MNGGCGIVLDNAGCEGRTPRDASLLEEEMISTHSTSDGDANGSLLLSEESLLEYATGVDHCVSGSPDCDVR